MPTVTVTVAGKAAPEMGKKRGRIKDTDGIIYQAMPSFLDMVNVGTAYELTYKDDEFKDAKFRVVEGVTPAMSKVPPSMRPAQPQYAAAPQPSYDQHKDESISVLAIMKCQQLPVGDRAGILHALKASALAWRDFKKWQKDGNIETGRQPMKADAWEEFPEQ